MRHLVVLSIFLVFSLMPFEAFAQTTEPIHKPDTHRHKQYAKVKNPIPIGEQSVSKGKQLYKKHCISCHGESGKGGTGKGGIGADLTDNLWIHGNTDGEIFHVIIDGVKGAPHMKGFKKELPKEMGWHLVNYIKGLNKPEGR